jgi:hypothetical protein
MLALSLNRVVSATPAQLYVLELACFDDLEG